MNQLASWACIFQPPELQENEFLLFKPHSMVFYYSSLSRLIQVVSKTKSYHIRVGETSVNFIKINYAWELNPQLKALLKANKRKSESTGRNSKRNILDFLEKKNESKQTTFYERVEKQEKNSRARLVRGTKEKKTLVFGEVWEPLPAARRWIGRQN